MNTKLYLTGASILALLVFPALGQARTLQTGSRGADVRTLQRSLAQRNFMRFDQVSGQFGELTWSAVMAFQKWRGIERDGVAGPITQRYLRKSGQPQPAAKGSANRLEIWRSSQLLAVVQNNQIRRMVSISSGRPGYSTPLGRFRIYSKVLNEWSHKYNAPMPYSSYFTGGIALHQSADVPGYPASHGCVRVPASWARDVWRAAPIGRQVIVLAR